MHLDGLFTGPMRATKGWSPPALPLDHARVQGDEKRPRAHSLARQIGPPHIAALICLLLVITYIVFGFASVPEGWSELLFAGIAGNLCWLIFATLNRQKRTVAQLQAREEQLRAQSALLLNTLENMGEGLSVFDRDGRLIAWNSRFASLLKFSRELSNTTLNEIILHMAKRATAPSASTATCRLS